jgi:Yip1 domain
MTLVRTPEGRAALLERIKAILLRPKAEWPKIAAEPASVSSLYSDYVVYVAAVPVLCALIGSLVFGSGFGGLTYRPSLFGALWSAIVQYALQLGGVYVFALIIDFIAPRFGGAPDRVSAFKLAAYSATASWMAGIFTLIPALGALTILGLYSLYLLYTGAPVVMRLPQERAMGFTVAIVAAGLVVGIVVALLLAALTPGIRPTSPDEIKGKISLPGGVTLDMDKINKASKQLEAVTKNIEKQTPGAVSGGAPPEAEQDASNLAPIAADALKSLIPASLPGGFARKDVSTSAGDAAGFSFASAKGVYTKDNASVTVSLVDMGVMGAFAALGSAFGANSSEETETSYSKMGKMDGRMTMEEFNRKTHSGRFGTIVNDRVMVEAEGSGATMAQLKAAVGAVDLQGCRSAGSLRPRAAYSVGSLPRRAAWGSTRIPVACAPSSPSPFLCAKRDAICPLTSLG